MLSWPGFGYRKTVGALVTLALLSVPVMAEPGDQMEAYIKALPPEIRTALIENYLPAGWTFSGFLKHRSPPQIYVSCPNEGCTPAAAGILDELQSRAPKTFGAKTAQADAAGIEIYLAPQADEFDKRDRDIDTRLHLDASISGRTVPKPNGQPGVEFVSAPCWTVIYFNQATGIIAKALIFIDSDEPARLQSLCLAFELVRAAGVMNTEWVLDYREREPGREESAFRWLALNAYLHGLSEIRPKDTMAKADRYLADRYGLKKMP